MMKRLFSWLMLICLVCGVLCSCQPKEEITSEEAVQIVMSDLKDKAAEAGTPHVHTGSYEDQACYNIYVTVDGAPLEYVISLYGEILHKGFGSHSH